MHRTSGSSAVVLNRLYNASSTAVDLAGWSITQVSDQDLERSRNGQVSKEGRHRLSEDMALLPGEFLVVYGLKSGLVLDTAGGQVRLLDPRGREVDNAIYGALAPDVSLSQGEDGAWYASEQPTPGKANTPPLAAALSTKRPAARRR
jgi:hypothetical protein